MKADDAARAEPTRHECGQWRVDSESLWTSRGALIRVACVHGYDRWLRVAPDGLRDYAPPPWVPEAMYEIGVRRRSRAAAAGPDPYYVPRKPAAPPEACWLCRAALPPPCALHGGPDPATRNRVSAARRYRVRRHAAAGR
jgi:hypothetical protein